GHHAHVGFTERRIYREKNEVVHYFTPDELREAYRGWIILRHEEGLIPCAQDGVRHVHSVDTILAQRPCSGGPATLRGPRAARYPPRPRVHTPSRYPRRT